MNYDGPTSSKHKEFPSKIAERRARRKRSADRGSQIADRLVGRQQSAKAQIAVRRPLGRPPAVSKSADRGSQTADRSVALLLYYLF